MPQRDARRRTAVIVVVLVLLLLLLGLYLIFLRDCGGTPPSVGAPDAAGRAPARPDAAQSRHDAPRTADGAGANPGAVPGPNPGAVPGSSPGARAGLRSTEEPAGTPQARAATPDAAPPAPDAAVRKPDARPKPDGRRFGKLPAAPPLLKPKPATVVTRLRNRMGSSFVLIELAYAIDGRQVYHREDLSGALDRSRDLDIFTGDLAPGRHTLLVQGVYRGAAHGVFKYHEGYRYKVHASYTFTVNPGKRTEVTVEAFERGGATTRLEDRPAFKFGYRSTAPAP